MASAARSASRAFLRSTPASSFRPAVRSSRFALPAQGFRASSRRGYASEAGQGKSSNGLLWAGLAVAGGAGAYFYLNGGDSVSSKNFVPAQKDYQKVYDEIARRLGDETDYDDGSYGPVSLLPQLMIFSPSRRWTVSKLIDGCAVIGSGSSGLARKRYL